jgi:zearalenone synthase (nonreducing iterative type I polyketide synthase)
VIGHSLGEYVALSVAGVVSAADALFLVGNRAMLMDSMLQPDTYRMLAIQISAAEGRRSLKNVSLLSYEIVCEKWPEFLRLCRSNR